MAEKIAPPIDRPLSKAYLREFRGWSTAYPPGMADAASLRVMHNCSIGADGGLDIRPGLRAVLSGLAPGSIVGDLEHFYLNDEKALLFAYREPNNRVNFAIAKYNKTTHLYDMVADIDTVFTPVGVEPSFGTSCDYVTYVQIDDRILALSNTNEGPAYFDLKTKKRKHIKALTRPHHIGEQVQVVMPTAAWIGGSQTTIPTDAPRTTSTLISSDPTKNVYHFAYFFTAFNELGETFTSGNTLVSTQRPLSAWRSNWIDSSSPDQLVIILPVALWSAMKAEGAIGWNLYMYTWSNQGVKPAEGVLLQSTIIEGQTHAQSGMVAHTPLKQPRVWTHLVPTSDDNDNYSDPPTASVGLVAGDRMVLVNNMDPNKRARIQWTANTQGNYLDFSPVKGGGYKTLTSGGLYRPEAVVLWQNPQSTDTITVLCSGPNGAGTAYYMNAGSTVTNQSQATVVMGFEETTATPGTVSPYGCEVLNNALYHPLEDQLMKSTASNYNINHKSMTDSISNLWQKVKLSDKRRMVSEQFDNKLYYLIYSPVGWTQAGGYTGNQIWVCDTAREGAWSCWDIPAESLHKLEINGVLYLAMTTGRGIFIFDPEADMDDYWDNTSMSWKKRPIPFEAITNTQGANRAHDAWANVYQVSVTFSDFIGECHYGIRGYDRHGKWVEAKKHFISPVTTHDALRRHDLTDHLPVRRDLKEWEFFFESVPDTKIATYGGVSHVQYRYTPISVNVGYAYGDVETFEYSDRTQNYSNAVPLPVADTARA